MADTVEIINKAKRTDAERTDTPDIVLIFSCYNPILPLFHFLGVNYYVFEDKIMVEEISRGKWICKKAKKQATDLI